MGKYKYISSLNRGVTLIELMVTIVVFAILASLAAPTMNDIMEKRRLTGAAEAIYDQLQLARSEAIKQSRDTYARFQGTTTINWCVGTNDLPDLSAAHDCDCNETNPADPDACTLLVHGEQNRVLKVLSSADFRDVLLVAAPTDIRFNFVRGTVPGGGNTIRLSTPSGYELNVVVSTIGRIRMCTPSTATRPVGGYPSC